MSLRSSVYSAEDVLVLEECGSALPLSSANRPRLPDITLRFLVPADAHAHADEPPTLSALLPVSIRPLHRELAGKRTLLFGVPSPFSPDCNDHLGTFIRTSSLLGEHGIDRILGVATEDVFVMHAWSQAHNLTGKRGEVTLASDGNGELCRRLNLSIDLSDEIMGARRRFRRFVMLVERDLSISRYALEPDDGDDGDGGGDMRLACDGLDGPL